MDAVDEARVIRLFSYVSETTGFCQIQSPQKL